MHIKQLKVYIIFAISLISSDLCGQNTIPNFEFNKKLILNDDLYAINSKPLKIKDKYYFAANYLESTSAEYIAIFSIDSLGKAQCLKTFRSSLFQITVQTILADNTNAILLIGNLTDSLNSSKGLMIKCDLNGTIQWAKTYSEGNGITFNSAIKRDSTILICGKEKSNNNAILINTKENGVVESSKKLNLTSVVDFLDIKLFSDGIILSGNENSQSAIFEIQNNSDSLTKYIFNSTGNISYFSKIAYFDSSSFIISGYSDAFSPLAGDAIICKWTISEPQKTMLKVFGIENDFQLLGLRIDKNSQILGVGRAEYFGNGIYNGIYLKLDEKLKLKNSRVLQNNFSSELHTTFPGDAKRINYFGIRNDNTTVNQFAYGLMNSDSSSLCEFQIAEIDTFNSASNISIASSLLMSFNITSQTVSLLSSNKNFQDSTICELGSCKVPVDIQVKNQTFCIGDTIGFSTDKYYPNISWFLNGIQISNKPEVEFIYELDSALLTLQVIDSANCIGHDEIVIGASNEKVRIIGNAKLCINDQNSWYFIQHNPDFNYSYNIQNGQLIENRNDSLHIEWNKGSGILKISLIDSSDCIISVSELPVLLDSGIMDKPFIQGITVDTLTRLTRLDFELNSIENLTNQEFRFYKVINGIQNFETIFLDDENQWIDPNYMRTTQYFIETENNCNFTLKSNNHQRMELSKKNSDLIWTDYVGWPNNKTSYFLMQNARIKNQLSSGFYRLNSVDDYLSCFRIMARNEDSAYESYSNEICFNFKESINLRIPNVITPNGDQKNDKFVIQQLDLFSENSLQIYDRWGQSIFYTENYYNQWPDSEVKQGTYYYILKTGDANSKKYYKGWVEVLK